MIALHSSASGFGRIGVPMEADAAIGIRALEDRLRILADALCAFAEASTDYQHLLNVIARKLADVVKDGCVVRLLSDDGRLSTAAIHLPIETRIAYADLLARIRAHVTAPHVYAAHRAP